MFFITTHYSKKNKFLFSLHQRKRSKKFWTVDPVHARDWKFFVKISGTSADQFIQHEHSIHCCPHKLDSQGRVNISVHFHNQRRVVKGILFLRWFNKNIFNPIISMKGCMFARIGNLYMQQPSLFECSLNMRYNCDGNLCRQYCHWQLTYSAVSRYIKIKTGECCGGQIYPKTWNIWSQIPPCEQKHLLKPRGVNDFYHKFVKHDTVLDASIVLFENDTLDSLDSVFSNQTHPSCVTLLRQRGSGILDPGKMFTIQFRRHVVLCYVHDNASITVINTSSHTFMDSMADYNAECSNKHQVRLFRKKRRMFYEKIWKELACKYIGLSTQCKAQILHLNLQGYNDCLIWTLYVAWTLLQKTKKKGVVWNFKILRQICKNIKDIALHRKSYLYQTFVLNACLSEYKSSTYFKAKLQFSSKWVKKLGVSHTKILETLIENTLNITPHTIKKDIDMCPMFLLLLEKKDGVIAIGVLAPDNTLSLLLRSKEYKLDAHLWRVANLTIQLKFGDKKNPKKRKRRI